MDNPNSAKEEFKCIAVFVQVKEVKGAECIFFLYITQPLF